MKGKIFNAQEVQAIIAGNKTMFREVVKTCKQHPNNVCRKVRNAHYGLNLKEDGLFWQPYGGSELQPFPYCDGKLSASTSLDEFCPYQVGQKIFVKENFYIAWKKRPAQHMKQEHSRLTLLIKSIKVERLRDISEEDARLEGFPVDHLGNYYEPSKLDPWQGYATASFSLSWNPTHKKPEEKFYANPFVWVVDFKVNK